MIILNIVLVIAAAAFFHEGGHFAAALCFGRRLEFRFAWGKLFGRIPVPRYIWYMPDIDSWKKQAIALSGFGAEITFALFVWLVHSPVTLIVAGLHLGLYRFYAGKDSDFKWL